MTSLSVQRDARRAAIGAADQQQPRPRSRSIGSRGGQRGQLWAWIFLAPTLLLFAVFIAWPLARSLVLSTQQTFGPGFTQPVGLGNFRALLADPLFWKALSNTAIFAAGSVFIQLPIALGLALLVESPKVRGRNVLRLVLFSPSLVGVVFAAMIFGIIFEKRTGLLNQILHAAIGFNLDFAWLQDHVMLALIVAALWMYAGFNMMFFCAALQNVPRDLTEAATLDGAGPLHRFRHVILPAIRPVTGYVVLLSVIGSFQLFELPFLMLNNTGGPDNRGLTVVMYLYQQGFETGDLGYASAIGWALTVVLVICTIGQRLLSRGEEAAA